MFDAFNIHYINIFVKTPVAPDRARAARSFPLYQDEQGCRLAYGNIATSSSHYTSHFIFYTHAHSNSSTRTPRRVPFPKQCAANTQTFPQKQN
jgi:hypothetical protein